MDSRIFIIAYRLVCNCCSVFHYYIHHSMSSSLFFLTIQFLLMIYVTLIHNVTQSLSLMMAFVLIAVIMSSAYSLISRFAFDHGQWWHIIVVMIISSGTSLYMVIKSARVMDEYQYGQAVRAFVSFFDLIDAATTGG
jgi:glucan phosphoethanolaminetransferase (alkaline phosphatase superfamily)